MPEVRLLPYKGSIALLLPYMESTALLQTRWCCHGHTTLPLKGNARWVQVPACWGVILATSLSQNSTVQMHVVHTHTNSKLLQARNVTDRPQYNTKPRTDPFNQAWRPSPSQFMPQAARRPAHDSHVQSSARHTLAPIPEQRKVHVVSPLRQSTHSCTSSTSCRPSFRSQHSPMLLLPPSSQAGALVHATPQLQQTGSSLLTADQQRRHTAC